MSRWFRAQFLRKVFVDVVHLISQCSCVPMDVVRLSCFCWLLYKVRKNSQKTRSKGNTVLAHTPKSKIREGGEKLEFATQEEVDGTEDEICIQDEVQHNAIVHHEPRDDGNDGGIIDCDPLETAKHLEDEEVADETDESEHLDRSTSQGFVVTKNIENSPVYITTSGRCDEALGSGPEDEVRETDQEEHPGKAIVQVNIVSSSSDCRSGSSDGSPETVYGSVGEVLSWTISQNSKLVHDTCSSNSSVASSETSHSDHQGVQEDLGVGEDSLWDGAILLGAEDHHQGGEAGVLEIEHTSSIAGCKMTQTKHHEVEERGDIRKDSPRDVTIPSAGEDPQSGEAGYFLEMKDTSSEISRRESTGVEEGEDPLQDSRALPSMVEDDSKGCGLLPDIALHGRCSLSPAGHITDAAVLLGLAQVELSKERSLSCGLRRRVAELEQRLEAEALHSDAELAALQERLLDAQDSLAALQDALLESRQEADDLRRELEADRVVARLEEASLLATLGELEDTVQELAREVAFKEQLWDAQQEQEQHGSELEDALRASCIPPR